MVTLTYGALFGLLLAAFILGLLFPVFLLIFTIWRQKPN